jgi:hypothetical protein
MILLYVMQKGGRVFVSPLFCCNYTTLQEAGYVDVQVSPPGSEFAGWTRLTAKGQTILDFASI